MHLTPLRAPDWQSRWFAPVALVSVLVYGLILGFVAGSVWR